MNYLDVDNIIYKLQRFGGASTFWRELTSRLPEFVQGGINNVTGHKLLRYYSPNSNAKIFHSSHFRTAYGKNVKNVTTIHDLIYEKNLIGGPGSILNLYERKKSVLKADAIVCISESTRFDLYEYYGKILGSKPVHVIHHGCTKLPLRLATQKSSLTLERYSGLNLSAGRFFMFVGGRSGYKNFEFLLNAFSAGGFSLLGLNIICTGSDFSKSEESLISALKLSNSVFSVGYLDPTSLGEFYSVARALVYPSSYEGFGLPVLEAMAAGCPVICANASSLPEVVGESAMLFDLKSVETLIVAMRAVLSDDTRFHYSQAGCDQAALFDWRECARAYSKVYESLVPF